LEVEVFIFNLFRVRGRGEDEIEGNVLTLPNSSVWVRWQKETEKPRLGRHQLIQLIPSPRRSPPGCHRLMRLIRALIARIVVVVVVVVVAFT